MKFASRIAAVIVALLVATSAILGLYLTQTEIPQRFAAWIISVSNDKIVVLIVRNLRARSSESIRPIVAAQKSWAVQTTALVVGGFAEAY